MMEKVYGLVGEHYPLQENSTNLLKHLSYEYVFVDLDLDKV